MAWPSFPFRSSTVAPKQCDLFVSFRGEDTRDKFASHLFAALKWRNIITYMDHNIKRGDDISENLQKAIQGSKVAIVIFSENYASSSWCLDELVKIIECTETKEQILLPIFYHVQPSDVRHQKGSYEKALAKHEQFHGRHTKEKLHGWRNALTKAANLRGFNSLEYRKEADLVEKIAEEVFLNLQNVQLAYEGMLQGEPLPRDEETSQEVLKRSLGKVVKVIKKHANASVSWNFRKGKAPSVDGNVECHF